ncbi:MAG TPA: ABC transporter permease [Puia sp.]|uniref:ABC transporter permease n=1 Tax=Puia sp. TaxID=2045100 RepID=UPI002CD7CD30|nr:ABC transporter permease [Puia sp.]HVU99625.1 ABC transporter permease [Puia sp.]
MLKSYWKTALRFLLKNKTFSAVNLIGLAAGTLCCLYIVLYVVDQYSYDKHHDHAEDIYRVTTAISQTGDNIAMATCSPPIAPAMKKDFPEVVEFTRAIPTIGVTEHLLTYKEKSFYETNALEVDSTFFDVFTYHFTNGRPAHVLSAPNSIVLKKPVADKLFGSEDPIGKTIVISDAYGKNNLTVTGVVDESLGKSHLQGNIYIRMSPGGFGSSILTNDHWAGNNFANAYVKLRPHSNPADLERKLPSFLQKYGAEQLRTSGMTKSLHLQPIGSIHTTAGFNAESAPTTDRTFLDILMLIAALIQLIACINFMNLSTARASNRAKEVGVRKIVGAGRKSLVLQFLGESFLLTLIGVAIAIPLLILFLPGLNHLTHATVTLSLLRGANVWLLLTGIVALTGLFAGSYPAFYLSAFQAIKVIKGNFTNQISAAGLRRSLVVFQFILSIVLISGIIVIHSQLNYIKNKDLGFSTNQQLVFDFHLDETKAKMPLLAQEFRRMPNVRAVSLATNYPGQLPYNDWGVYLSGGNEATAVDQQNFSSDEYSLKALGIGLVSGRDFHYQDSGATLINETLARRLGLDPAIAPGTKLYTPSGSLTIVGVMKDFNYRSLKEPIHPFMIIYNPNNGDISHLIVNANTTDYAGLLSQMETIWKKVLPSTPFAYSFLDEEVGKFYTADIILSQIINSFTLMAILISSLGLFGLAAFSAEQRRKEIGVRKVLGANTTGLVRLLTRDFIRLVAIAFCIATPIAWWAMNKWLQEFTFRVTLSWWMFALAGAGAMLIAICTISVQAVKAALANPVKSLRSE